MLHKTFAADTVATDTDLGQFEAIVSAWDADREGDVIARSAFDTSIAAWQRSSKRLPLLFEHSPIVVGAVDPHSMQAADAGLIVAGQVDRSTDEGKQAWRSIKSGVAGFSIGYMSESRPRKGGGRELVEIDLLEVSITSTPMHPSTRATSWKSAAEGDLPSGADQRRRAARLLLTTEQERDLARELARFKKMLAETEASAARTKSTEPIRIASFPVE